MATLTENLKAFQALKTNLYQKDFLLTWEHPEEELKAILAVADALKQVHKKGQSYRSFETGLAI
ncbi:MAG: knotted carbamoyltransferase YgeW, partial [Acidobacteria bacterium]|nr:knotted carbamoyltransferase YgeW [Acidobacteriota bacterium]